MAALQIGLGTTIDCQTSGDGRRNAACGLLGVQPITLAGAIAWLVHARDYDDATYGMGWPTDLVDADWREGRAAGCLEDTRSWQYFLIAYLIEDLPGPTAA
jgi:hypothetical protein